MLKLAITAGIGSDHVDLDAAIKHGMTVAEVTYSNSISVAEHVVMMILGLVRNTSHRTRWCSTAAGTSGSSLSAQTRYAAGTREILESWLAGTPIRDEYLIVDGGRLAGVGAHSYSTRV
ncbi:hypothetical protein AB0E63_26610 [Kribbella sp. NPDC026596]|uniref:hypothetical protein n=1 Tax=Kribbella sp. NPDC026596 TaxID=3155122 RepID=UPI0033C5BCAC